MQHEIPFPSPRPIAKVLWPRPSLTGCIMATFVRDTRGCQLTSAQRMTHFAAAPFCGVSWFIEGRAHLVDWHADAATPEAQPVLPRLLFHGPHRKPITGLKARMDDLERQKAEITARIAVETPPLPDVNPNIAVIYRHKAQLLSVALADPTTAQEATSAIRSLIGEIVLTPGNKRGEVHATLRGELMSILDFAAGRTEKRTNAPRVITAVASSP